MSPFPPQGTTVRMITAIDQDKGRPRGIGYTIVSGKLWGDVVGSSAGMEKLSCSKSLYIS